MLQSASLYACLSFESCLSRVRNVLTGLGAGVLLLSRSWRDMSEDGHVEASPVGPDILPPSDTGDVRVGRSGEIVRSY